MSEFKSPKELAKYKQVDTQIKLNEETGQYYVTIGRSRVNIFPTLDDARAFRDELNAERLKAKTAKAKAIYEKEANSEIARITPYPYNILECAGIDGDDVEDSVIDGFDSIVESCCTDRERICVFRRFKDGETLDAIGKSYDVGKERIRQICAKATRKIGRRIRMAGQIEQANFERMLRQKEHDDLIAKREALLEEFRKRGVYTDEMIAEFGEVTFTTDKTSGLSVDDLNLSTRSANCLKRAGIYTVGDIITRSVSDMMKIRNLGKNSLKEIIAALEERGLYLKEEK